MWCTSFNYVSACSWFKLNLSYQNVYYTLYSDIKNDKDAKRIVDVLIINISIHLQTKLKVSPLPGHIL